MSITAVMPLPINEKWTPSYLKARGDGNRDFAFMLPDAQGAPDKDGTRRHGGVDWFAPGGTVLKSPCDGRVVRSEFSRDRSGPVFGGVIIVERADGICFVFRHVNPMVRLGAEVDPGEPIARVTDWADGSDHAHLEIWRDLDGGYRIANMIDPKSVTWVDEVEPVVTPRYWFEELPFNRGGRGPAILGKFTESARANAFAEQARGEGRRISTLAGTDGLFYVLEWAEGTYGRPFRFGPWLDRGDRDRVAGQREKNTGRKMRRFAGRASMYPYPKV